MIQLLTPSTPAPACPPSSQMSTPTPDLPLTSLLPPFACHKQGSHRWDQIVVDVEEVVQLTKKPENSFKESQATKKSPIPNIGKKRANPVPPSKANFAACSQEDQPKPKVSESPYGPYKCEVCGQTFKWAGSIFKHMKLDHNLTVPNDSSDSLLYFIAEQNEEVNQKLSETTEKLNAMQAQVAEILRSLTPVKCNKCNYTAPTAGVLSNHMEVKHSTQQRQQQDPRMTAKPSQVPTSAKPSQSHQQPPPQPQWLRPPPLFPQGLPQAQPPPPGAQTHLGAKTWPPLPPGAQAGGRHQAISRPKGKLQHLHITDSVGRNILYPVLESKTGSLILPHKATPSVHDERAYKPQENVHASQW